MPWFAPVTSATLPSRDPTAWKVGRTAVGSDRRVSPVERSRPQRTRALPGRLDLLETRGSAAPQRAGDAGDEGVQQSEGAHVGVERAWALGPHREPGGGVFGERGQRPVGDGDDVGTIGPQGGDSIEEPG